MYCKSFYSPTDFLYIVIFQSLSLFLLFFYLFLFSSYCVVCLSSLHLSIPLSLPSLVLSLSLFLLWVILILSLKFFLSSSYTHFFLYIYINSLFLSFSLIVHCFVSSPIPFFPSTVSFHLYTVTSFHFIPLPPDVFISVSPNFLAFSSSYPSFFIPLSFPSFPFFPFIYLSHRSHSLSHMYFSAVFSLFFSAELYGILPTKSG